MHDKKNDFSISAKTELPYPTYGLSFTHFYALYQPKIFWPFWHFPLCCSSPSSPEAFRGFTYIGNIVFAKTKSSLIPLFGIHFFFELGLFENAGISLQKF
jgi:hypothetical protein